MQKAEWSVQCRERLFHQDTSHTQLARTDVGQYGRQHELDLEDCMLGDSQLRTSVLYPRRISC